MNTDELVLLKKLYSQGQSMKKIAHNFGCSEHKIAYWMNKLKIVRRSRSEANYMLYNPNGDPFKIKNDLGLAETMLLGLALGIYWGEGDKMSHHQVRVTNTDPNMLKVFIRFLVEIYGVSLEKIRYSIVCFNDSDPKEAEEYWSKELSVPVGRFGKIVQIPPQGKGSYKRKSKFGVCSVIVSNVKLKALVLEEIGKLK